MNILIISQKLEKGALRTYPNKYIYDIFSKLGGDIYFLSTFSGDESEYVYNNFNIITTEKFPSANFINNLVCSKKIDKIIFAGNYFSLFRYSLIESKIKNTSFYYLIMFDLRNVFDLIRNILKFKKIPNYVINYLLNPFLIKIFLNNKHIIVPSLNIKNKLLFLDSHFYLIPPEVLYREVTLREAKEKECIYLAYFGPNTNERAVDMLIELSNKLREIKSSYIVRLYLRNYRVEDSKKNDNIILSHENMQVITENFSEDDIIQQISKNDIIICPFRYTYFTEYPYVIFESMIAQKPIITTKLNAIGEMSSNFYFLNDCDDVEEYINMVNEIVFSKKYIVDYSSDLKNFKGNYLLIKSLLCF